MVAGGRFQVLAAYQALGYGGTCTIHGHWGHGLSRCPRVGLNRLDQLYRSFRQLADNECPRNTYASFESHKDKRKGTEVPISHRFRCVSERAFCKDKKNFGSKHRGNSVAFSDLSMRGSHLVHYQPRMFPLYQHGYLLLQLHGRGHVRTRYKGVSDPLNFLQKGRIKSGSMSSV